MKVAELEDLPEILEMSMKFMSETEYDKLSDEDTIRNLIEQILTSDNNQNVIILEPGVGFLAGGVTPFLFGKGMVATELAWYVSPEFRGKKTGSEFLQAFEYWAKEKAGCSMVTMMSLDERLDKFYTGNGYRLSERTYLKVI